MNCRDAEKLARFLCEEDGLDPDAEEWVGWDADTGERLCALSGSHVWTRLGTFSANIMHWLA